MKYSDNSNSGAEEQHELVALKGQPTEQPFTKQLCDASLKRSHQYNRWIKRGLISSEISRLNYHLLEVVTSHFLLSSLLRGVISPGELEPYLGVSASWRFPGSFWECLGAKRCELACDSSFSPFTFSDHYVQHCQITQVAYIHWSAQAPHLH